VTTGLAVQTILTLPKADITIHNWTIQKNVKIRRLSLMIDYEDEEMEPKPVSKKVYIIIDDEKHYIDPEIVKKYNLEKEKVAFFSGRKLYVEKE
jgi:hypothetical protein